MFSVSLRPLSHWCPGSAILNPLEGRTCLAGSFHLSEVDRCSPSHLYGLERRIQVRCSSLLPEGTSHGYRRGHPLILVLVQATGAHGGGVPFTFSRLKWNRAKSLCLGHLDCQEASRDVTRSLPLSGWTVGHTLLFHSGRMFSFPCPCVFEAPEVSSESSMTPLAPCWS